MKKLEPLVTSKEKLLTTRVVESNCLPVVAIVVVVLDEELPLRGLIFTCEHVLAGSKNYFVVGQFEFFYGLSDATIVAMTIDKYTIDSQTTRTAKFCFGDFFC